MKKILLFTIVLLYASLIFSMTPDEEFLNYKTLADKAELEKDYVTAYRLHLRAAAALSETDEKLKQDSCTLKALDLAIKEFKRRTSYDKLILKYNNSSSELDQQIRNRIDDEFIILYEVFSFERRILPITSEELFDKYNKLAEFYLRVKNVRNSKTGEEGFVKYKHKTPVKKNKKKSKVLITEDRAVQQISFDDEGNIEYEEILKGALWIQKYYKDGKLIREVHNDEGKIVMDKDYTKKWWQFYK